MWNAPPPTDTEWLPALDMPDAGPQNRLTVLVRLLLAIPQIIVVWVLSVIGFFVAVIGWVVALVTAELPEFAVRYLGGYVGYDTRVNAYLQLTLDAYPPFRFDAPDYPVRIELRPGPLNRLAVLFRLILAIPAAIVQSVLYSGWWTVALISWIVVLVLGRMPDPLFEATAAILRYRMRFQAYLLMLTSAYPKRLFGDELDKTVPRSSATRPLLLSSGGRVLLVVFIVIGAVSYLVSSFTTDATWDDDYDASVTRQLDLLDRPAPLGGAAR
ncbi:DUF4389 domain-containing protein [Kitasatospora camelliae]|uniref:DUF4389 domain-containing protein n=1 Tax=Kitasatospora camelliae TaxID=3156397 RepID=A0AAU8JVP6_9ACTN